MSDLLRNKILHTLSIYPLISPSMLQIGIGPSIPAALWREDLRNLIENGYVSQVENVHDSAIGRTQMYTKLSLTDKGRDLAIHLGFIVNSEAA